MIVQRHAMEAWENDGDFRAAIAGDPAVSNLLSADQLASTFSLERHLKHVDAIFERVFGDAG
jgi:adenylosuccinate lyase